MTVPQRKRDGALGKVVWENAPEKVYSTKPPKKFPYEDLLNILRDHPGQSARIAAFTEGTKAQKLGRQRNQVAAIRKHLDTNCPLELWTIKSGQLPTGWYDRGIWATFLRPCTQQEHEAEMARRHAVYQRIRGITPAG